MRVHLAILISAAVFVCFPAIAQQDADESKLVEKIGLLGGTVERDESVPGHPVVKVSIRGSKKFTTKYLHLFNGFKHLKEIDFGDLVFTSDQVKELWQSEVLANLLMDANETQFKGLLPRLDQFNQVGLPIWNAELGQKPLLVEIPYSDPKREARAKRQANAAIALLRMNQSEKVWPLLKHSPDPRLRSHLIHRFASFGIDANVVIQRLIQESDITIRRALVLSLGEYDEHGLPQVVRNELLPMLQEMYKMESDPGLHSAVGWLLRKWNQEKWIEQTNVDWTKGEAWKESVKKVEQKLANQKENASPQWYVNSQGQTMIVIPGSVEFMMGSPGSEVWHINSEQQHWRRIGRSFAIAATTVTLHQYRQFENGYGEQFAADCVRQSDLPAIKISWYMGAKYCNWLSEQENLQPCYDIAGDEITLKRNYLNLTGYRFPTEAEMEYATRAGTETSRYFGESDELLSNYAWYQANSKDLMQPVGLLKPNDFGFFDIQGNVWNWCQNEFQSYQVSNQRGEEAEGAMSVSVTSTRALRGGSFFSQSSNLRSSDRFNLMPKFCVDVVGFRLARTLPVVPLTTLPPLPPSLDRD